MIQINNKENCCGCCACVDICPNKAISLKNDIEGFWYPEIDMDLCIDCGLCESVCPELNVDRLRKEIDVIKPLKTYAAINKDMKVRWDSTSGGAFSAMATEMYLSKGYVGGAIYNEDFSVKNYISNDAKDIDKLRSSKYLQSKAEGIFTEIKKILENGENVLVCGTPCQMVALRLFLNKDYQNLLIVDFVCRGVNSPKVYRKYLDSLEKQYNGKVIYVKAKNKELGWRNLTRKIVFDNNKSYYGVAMKDDFRRGYHTNVYCRPSCYSCKFKGFPRIADITIGDCWGIEKIDKNLDNNIGTSLIIINNKKGLDYFERTKVLLEKREIDLNIVLGNNTALLKSIPSAKINREDFFNDLEKNDFDYVVKKYFPLTMVSKNWKIKTKNILKFGYLLWTLFGVNVFMYIKNIRYNFFKKNIRSNFFKKYLMYITSNTVLDIDSSAQVYLESGVILGSKPVRGSNIESRLKMTKGTSLIFKQGPLTRYGNDTYLLRCGFDIQIVNNGELTIGQGASNIGLNIMCAYKITIGNGVRIGRNVTIRDWNGPHVIINKTYRNHAAVKIGNNVWLCSGATIMPGVTIGEGSVIGANAIVTRDVPSKSLVVGNPGRVIKENIEWY